MRWEISKTNTKSKFMKIDHFLGQFPSRKSKIWKFKFISWRSALKNEENIHLRFFIFEFITEIFAKHVERFSKI